MIALAASIEGLLAVRTARKAVTEKVEMHLIDKAADTANIIDGRVTAFWQFLEGIARMPILTAPNVSYDDKMVQLKLEAAFNEQILELNIVDMKGTRYTGDGIVFSVSDRDWFKAASSGKNFFSEPLQSRIHAGKLIAVFAVPIYNEQRQVVNVLAANVDGLWLSDQIKDIIVGKTGSVYIVGTSGTTIADPDSDTVTSMWNSTKAAESDNRLKPLAEIEQKALNSKQAIFGTYYYKGVVKISAGKAMNNGWAVIVFAPYEEFMGTVTALRSSLLGIGAVILVIALAIVFFLARAMIKPVNVVVSALKNIAQGEGDLTVRLPITGNDEVTDLSRYFNETIAKIGKSIRSVGINSNTMEESDDISCSMRAAYCT